MKLCRKHTCRKHTHQGKKLTGLLAGCFLTSPLIAQQVSLAVWMSISAHFLSCNNTHTHTHRCCGKSCVNWRLLNLLQAAPSLQSNFWKNNSPQGSFQNLQPTRKTAIKAAFAVKEPRKRLHRQNTRVFPGWVRESHPHLQTGPEPKHTLRARSSTGGSSSVTRLLQKLCRAQSHQWIQQVRPSLGGGNGAASQVLSSLRTHTAKLTLLLRPKTQCGRI